MREVITLQFGSFANFVGSHYWNFQDETLGLQETPDRQADASQIDSGVLYRSGETLQGNLTYTPRLVLFDLSGSLGSVSPAGALYGGGGGAAAGSAAGVRTWQGPVEVHRRPPAHKPTFLQALEAEAEEPEPRASASAAEQGEAAAAAAAAAAALAAAAGELDVPGGVVHPTDYLKAHLHPNSVALVPGAWQGSADVRGYGGGGELFPRDWLRDEALERIRFFAEECDSLQGFQALVDDGSGFGSAAATVLQEVRDVYGRSRPALLYALRPEAAASGSDVERRLEALSAGASLALLSQQCDAYCVVAPPTDPHALPALSWRRGDPFHAAAICAAALEGGTTPYRLAAGDGPIGRSSLADQAELLSSRHPTPLAALSLALPCGPLPADEHDLAAHADARVRRSSADASGSSGPAAAGRRRAAGLPCASLTPGVRSASSDGGKYAESAGLRGAAAAGGGAAPLAAAARALDAALVADGARCVRWRALSALALPVPLPFPRLLAGGGSLPAACPLLTRLSATPALGDAVDAAERGFTRAAAGPAGDAVLRAWGLGKEERGELAERFASLRHAYDPGSD